MLTAEFVRIQLGLENPSSPEPIEPWNPLIPEEQSNISIYFSASFVRKYCILACN